MCHRYNLKTNLNQLTVPFGGDIDTKISKLPTADFYPMKPVIVMRINNNDQWTIEKRQWGWLPKKWRPSTENPTRAKYQRGRFNARSESIHSTWAFKFAFGSQRCVLPATSFFEPQLGGGNGQYTLPDAPIFYLAALWDRWEDDGDVVESCTMLTTEANALVADNRTGRLRQPVILTDMDDVHLYCNLEVTERNPLESLFHPIEAHQMRHEVWK